MFSVVLGMIRNKRRYKLWRRKNTNNFTVPVNNFNYENVKIGNGTYGELTVLDFGKNSKLSIGHFCSIASGVVFNLSGDHDSKLVSTYPFKVKYLKTAEREAVTKGNINVADDVWIGQNAIIMSGVEIQQGAIIAAGAVVTKNIPAYAIAAGVPAKIIGYRFGQDIIDKLIELDYSQLSVEKVRDNLENFYQHVDSVEQLEWIDKL